MKSIISAAALAAAALPAAVSAQEEGTQAVTISGSATLASDHRFRGV